MKKTIAIDMDGVIADVELQALHWYKRLSGITLTKADVLGRTEEAFLPDGLFRKFIYQSGFFRTAPVMEGAVEALLKLSEAFEIYIVSAAMEFPDSLSEKRAWLSEHFPFISWKNIVFCGDKSIIKTDYMIDDHPKNLDFCVGKPVMFASFHNNHIDRFDCFSDWQGVLAYFEREVSLK